VPLYSKHFKADSGTKISLYNPSVSTIQGNTGGTTIIGGSTTADTLTLQANSNTYPRTARMNLDMINVMNTSYTWPSASTASFIAIQSSPTITGIDVASPAVNLISILPVFTYDVAQSWGLAPKQGLQFAPTFTSNVGSAGSDSCILQGANFQPQVNLASGPRTWTNLWAIGCDPRMTGSGGTVSVMTAVRTRGNTITGGTVTTFNSVTSDFVVAAGSVCGTYNGMILQPTFTGTVSDYNGFYVVGSSAPTGNNIGFRQTGTSTHNRFQGYVQMGADSTPSHPLVLSATRTETAGSIFLNSNTLTINPTTDSTTSINVLDVVGITSTGAANKASTLQGSRYLVHRSATDTSSIDTIRGIYLQALNTAALSTGSGSVPTLLEGANFQAFDNSSTTVATTTIRGVIGSANLSSNVVSSRVVTNFEGANFTLGLSAGSTAATVTNGRVIYVDCLNSTSLNRTGTFTNAYGLDISGWTTSGGIGGTGWVFTNPPEQIHLQSMTVANSIGIRQVGSTPHNRFNGNVKIGADSAPASALDVTGAGIISSTFNVTGATTLGSTLSVTGHVTVEGVTSTGATGTGKFVFDASPTFSGTVTLPTIVQTGKTTTYNNIATVSNGLPSIVATVDLTAQSATIATTTLYAVPASGAGQYRISWNSTKTRAATTASTNGTLTLTYTGSDSIVRSVTCPATNSVGTSVTFNNVNATASTGCLWGMPFIIDCKASTNIQYSFGYINSGVTTMQYDLRIKLESL